MLSVLVMMPLLLLWLLWRVRCCWLRWMRACVRSGRMLSVRSLLAIAICCRRLMVATSIRAAASTSPRAVSAARSLTVWLAILGRVAARCSAGGGRWRWRRRAIIVGRHGCCWAACVELLLGERNDNVARSVDVFWGEREETSDHTGKLPEKTKQG